MNISPADQQILNQALRKAAYEASARTGLRVSDILTIWAKATGGPADGKERP